MAVTTVCVFCASSDAVASDHRGTARALGTAIAREGWSLMYGGGNIGLMGEVARAALDAGAHVTGVIPHLLANREVALEEVSRLVRTDTMRERKALMDEGSDAFLVLPGGIGTLEEVVEILTLKQLGYHDRPIILLDPTGYWDPLLALLERMVEQGLADPELTRLLESVDDVQGAIKAVREQHGAQTGDPSDVALELETGDASAEAAREVREAHAGEEVSHPPT
ncbi:MAG: TIGR00730 family Rossman fold protein [Nitriliruptorales bacterium]|nr:TIGR00730 family Rossman fold protein [Nitriliruptorales bacterium]